MRHLWSLLAGVLIAPLAWLGVAAGQSGSVQAVAEWQQAGRYDTAELLAPAGFLVAVGVLLGLVGTLRLSPAGPLAAGLLLVAPTVFMFINPFEALDAFAYDETSRVLGQDMQLWRPVQNGTLLVLGALLLMAVFSTGRWRRPAPEPLLAAGALAPAASTETASTEAGSASTETASDEEIVAAAADIDEPESQPGAEPDTGSASDPEDKPAGKSAQESAQESAGKSAPKGKGSSEQEPSEAERSADSEPDEPAGSGASGSKSGGSGGSAS